MIYSCESKTWKRLTSAHCAKQPSYRSAPRAEQTSERSADSRALLAYINIWASDEEKLHLKHLQETNIHEFRSYILEVVTMVMMRVMTTMMRAMMTTTTTTTTTTTMMRIVMIRMMMMMMMMMVM